MSITENRLDIQTSDEVKEEQIPEQAQDIIKKIESQFTSIVQGLNQVFIDHGVPEATIGDFQYIIQISVPSKPRPKPPSNGNSLLSEVRPLSNGRPPSFNGQTDTLKLKMCPVEDESGVPRFVPCP